MQIGSQHAGTSGNDNGAGKLVACGSAIIDAMIAELDAGAKVVAALRDANQVGSPTACGNFDWRDVRGLGDLMLVSILRSWFAFVVWR